MLVNSLTVTGQLALKAFLQDDRVDSSANEKNGINRRLSSSACLPAEACVLVCLCACARKALKLKYIFIPF